ncbi:MAG: hypothetical protein KC646_14060 [Candidatus Cloacimonetes bacterium]|nr:hypothetical protein [Candidatus Cloacimonadota bacterium]
MTEFQKNTITYLLQLGKSSSLYYGKLNSPYKIFSSIQQANCFKTTHHLGDDYKIIQANDELLESYYSTCF